MAREYDFNEIEERWKQRWIDDNLWAAPKVPDGEKRYAVTMFPYPSGDMHMGHVEIFSIHDAIARYYRMKGYDVLSPLGFDAFGLPAENAEIKRGINPKEWTYSNIEQLWASAQRLGCSFDWSRRFATCDPEYYRWNQWFFIKFFERGLAYRKAAPANWCPNDKTVLANEQVVGGHCDRCGALVEKRWLTQWFYKTTEYADRLLDDMALNEGWSDRLEMLQRNWIGRSYGAEVQFTLDGIEDPVTVYTTRPDTLWGATFFVMAPEHQLADELVKGTDKETELAEFRDEVSKLTDVDRLSTEREKRGMFTGKYALNPVNGERIPVWVADYVLIDYGTGAIMAVPAHDQRDFEFARAYGLEIRPVIQPPEGGLDGASMNEAYSGPGGLASSGDFDGTSTEESVAKVTEWLDAEGLGRAATNFRLRDWLISRQRYWGTPIPIVYCDEHGEVPVPLEELPIVLPDDVDFNPSDEASPLATATDWVNTTCPKCGAPARRETDTMDTFVDSSWYFNRYTDHTNDELPFDPAIANQWMPIDQYTGGIEHAVLHLIYARFFQKVLVDMGMAEDPEPFPSLLNQGTVTMGGKRMSKSRGNLVAPAEAFQLYGADALRLYMLFSGPPEQDFDWPEEGVSAIGRVTVPWLQRVWRLCEDVRSLEPSTADGEGETELRALLHRSIKVITHDYENLAFNTAIARLMELVNGIYRYRAQGGVNTKLLRESTEAVLKLLAPMAPYLTEEQWLLFGNDYSIHKSTWPTFDESLARVDEVTMVVQVNGKVRDTIAVPAEITEEEMKELALSSEKIQGYLGGKDPLKVIARPPKLLSLVVAKD